MCVVWAMGWWVVDWERERCGRTCERAVDACVNVCVREVIYWQLC